MLSRLLYQVAPVEQLPLNIQQTATSSQLQHTLKATLLESTCKMPLSPSASLSFPTSCAGVHSDTPHGACLTFSRQAFSTVVSLTADLAKH